MYKILSLSDTCSYKTNTYIIREYIAIHRAPLWITLPFTAFKTEWISRRMIKIIGGVLMYGDNYFLKSNNGIHQLWKLC